MNRYQPTFSCGNGNAHDDKLIRKMQEIDFSIYETVLYLDAYPNCREALDYYHSLLDAREILAAEYQKKHGPLTAFSNMSKTSWDWTKTPWPWQM
jgi:spore coat protein JB